MRLDTAPCQATLVGECLLALLHEPPRVADLPYLDEGQSDQLVRAAYSHGVAAMVHDALAQADQLPKLAPPARQAMAKLRLDAAARHLLTSADLHKLATALGSANVPWAVMKGPAVAYLGYRDPTVRWSCDLDVLVSASAFGPALDALIAAGATLHGLDWHHLLSLSLSEAGVELPLGTILDLHWHPVNNRQARSTTSLDIDAVLSRRRLVPNDAGLPLHALCPVDNMIFVALHASLAGGHRLLWAKDIERLARHDPPDWDELERRAFAYHVALPVGIMLRRAARLLGAEVPPDTVRALMGGRREAGLWSLAERLARPGSLARNKHTGTAFICSLTGTHRGTAVALTRTLVRPRLAKLGVPPHGKRGVGSTTSLPRSTGEAAAREAYLSVICADKRSQLTPGVHPRPL